MDNIDIDTETEIVTPLHPEHVDKHAMGITEGRVAHYQVETSPGIVECRAALIVQSWPNTAYQHGEINLTVFTDWTNDAAIFGGKDPLVWKTSVPYHQPIEPGTRIAGTWHFPPDDVGLYKAELKAERKAEREAAKSDKESSE